MTQEVKMFYCRYAEDKSIDTQIMEYLKKHPTYTLFDLHMNQEFTMAIAVFNIDKKLFG